MSEPTPELRALASTLFAAGRAERPAPALGRRLMLIGPPCDGAMAPPQTSPGNHGVAPGRRWVAPSRRAFWLAAAALLAGGIGAGVALAPEPPPIAISAERARGPLHTLAREQSGAGRAKEGNTARRPASTRAPAESPPEDSSTRPRALGSSTPSSRHDESRTNDARAGIAARSPAKALEKAARPSIRPLVANERVQSTAALEDAPVEMRPAPSSKRADSAPVEASAHAKPRLSLREELQLLGQARARLRASEALQALELLDRHARERDNRGLDAEATLLRIETYAALGRSDDASALATRFLRDNPNSALGDRARSFIGSAPARAP